MATEVCLTIDVEFSIGGAFSAPERRRPLGAEAVRGLDFILETLARHGLRATFFIEALNRCWFGDGPMAAVAHRILGAGHDAQLHLHPCWLFFRKADWKGALSARRAAGLGPPDDSCAGRSLEEMTEMLAFGLDAFARWNLPRPVALRTGSLLADRTVYRAMGSLGLPLASNLGIGLNRPADPALQLRGGRHLVEGVIEVPVLTYGGLRIGPWREERLLTVTGSSWPETRSLLKAVRASGMSPLVALTHPAEFVKSADGRSRPNAVNRRRLERLCGFLVEHRDDFPAVTFAERKDAWTAAAPTANPGFSVPPVTALGRMVENRLNDLVWRY